MPPKTTAPALETPEAGDNGTLTAAYTSILPPARAAVNPTGSYPADWPDIARRVKDEAAWRCIRCGHPHDRPSGHVLTVHHLDMNPANSAWWNLAPLCQRCHLKIQRKVVMARVWQGEHSAWFRPFVAGWTAFHVLGLDLDRATATAHADLLIALHQGYISAEAARREVGL